MKHLCAALLGLLLASAAQAQQVVNPLPNAGAYGAYNSSSPTCISGTGCWLQTDINGNLKITGTVTSSIAGTTSNASSGVVTSSTNVPTVSYNYLWNGTTWDQAPGTTANGSYVQGAVASGAADSGNGVKVAGVNMTTLPTLTNGQRGDLQVDTNGNLRTLDVQALVTGTDAFSNSLLGYPRGNGSGTSSIVIQATAPSIFNGSTWDRQRGTAANGTFVSPGGFSYTHITTAATTVIKSGAGSLHTICVNTVGAGATITVDDAASATTPTIAILSGATLGCYTYDVAFSVGLTIVTAITAPDITVSWR